MDINFIVRTTKVGGHDLTEMKKEIANLIILEDDNHDAFGNFINAMKYSDKPCVHLEDDVILTTNFHEKILNAIKEYKENVIQFFSMRKDDLTKGTRFVAGSTFSMNQCFYLPKGMGLKIAEYYKTSKRKFEKGAPYDLMMADYFKENKIRYLIWIPNLVDHVECVSRIDKRRSRKRQSLTFKK